MSPIAKLYRDQYRSVEDAVESWKPDHDKAMAACDIEEMLHIYLDVNKRIIGRFKKQWKMGFEGKIKDVEASGKSALKVLKAGVDAGRVIVDVLELFEADGWEIRSSVAVLSSYDELRKLHDDFATRWPFAREEDIARGAKEIAEGKYVTGEELLRELQGESG